jgi:hypothetical protein
MMRPAFALALISTLLASTPASADDKTGSNHAVTAEEEAEDATSPLPTRPQLRFRPRYSFPNGAIRYDAELQFEARLPYPGALIPDLDLWGLWSLVRVQVTGESLENAAGTFGGLEDLTFVDVAVKSFGPVFLGAGLGSVFPLATSPELGTGKWQLGPAVAGRFDPLPGTLRIATLTQAIWSVAGSNQFPNLAYVSVQPFITWYLPAQLFLLTDATMRFVWAGGATTVPVNLGFGHAFSDHFVGTVRCYVTLTGPQQGAIQGELDLNFRP